jgi:hypothetical protein
VFYGGDVPASGLHGSWTKVADGSAAGGVKLTTPDNGWSTIDGPLAAPGDYIDVTFNAAAAVPYTVWLRLNAASNIKYNDSVWLQFSDALIGGSPAYPLNTTAGLLVNLENCSACGLAGWGWQNTSWWALQPATVSFATTGLHTLRIQVREDGVSLDQIILSANQYLTARPGAVKNDRTIVSKP